MKRLMRISKLKIDLNYKIMGKSYEISQPFIIQWASLLFSSRMIFNLCCLNFLLLSDPLFRLAVQSCFISFTHARIHSNFICSLPIYRWLFSFIFRTLVEEKCEKSVQTFLLLPIEFVTQRWDTRHRWVWVCLCMYALSIHSFCLHTRLYSGFVLIWKTRSWFPFNAVNSRSKNEMWLVGSIRTKVVYVISSSLHLAHFIRFWYRHTHSNECIMNAD